MLKLRNWHVVTPDGGVAIGYEGDNLSYRLEIDSDTGPEWRMMLDVQKGEDIKTIDLERDGAMLCVDLTWDMLGRRGLYTAQIRGINGNRVAHSERFFIRVRESVGRHGGCRPWMPSEFLQMECRMEELLARAEDAAERAEEACSGGEFGTVRPATADQLGGVKVGAGLSVAEDGTLSVNRETVMMAEDLADESEVIESVASILNEDEA